MKKTIKDMVIITGITLVLAECVLRLLGFSPYVFQSYSIVSSPQNHIVPHPELGFALGVGDFDVTINEGLTYHTTHGKDSFRITAPQDTFSRRLPQINIYGCSFAYGMGVDDEKTFAYHLQDALYGKYAVKNKAVPGYGTIQNYLQIRTDINAGNKPQFALLFYADFHKERNVLADTWRENLYYGFLGGKQDDFKANFPYLQALGSHFIIKKEAVSDLFSPLPLRTYSSLSNAFQEVISKQNLQAEFLTEQLFLEMNNLCQNNDIQLIVLSVVSNEGTAMMLEKLSNQGIETLDIGLDILGDNQYNNQPYDSHPNAHAHEIYASKLLEYFDSSLNDVTQKNE